MDSSLLSALLENYNWPAALAVLLGVVIITKAGKYLAFKVPALARMKQVNREEDKKKLARPKYRPMVNSSKKVGLYCNLTFFFVVLPFCVTMAPMPLWKILLDVVIILMFYDFFYYSAHRWWFHGNGPMRQIHAVHHQARSPTFIDALYVHPIETFIGLALYIGSIVFLSALMGPFHTATMIISFVIYVQINTINHTFVDLPYFPFKTLSWITAKHHVHHINMHKGNYATITLLFDKLFGTLD